MTEIRFYHLQKQSLDQALPIITQKAYATGKHVLIQFGDKANKEHMNKLLWRYSDTQFLPHGIDGDPNPEKTPIWLVEHKEGAEIANTNDAKILIIADGAAPSNDDISGFDLCCDMIDGRSDEQTAAARLRWKAYKESGFDVTYWMQSESGGWEKKA